MKSDRYETRNSNSFVYNCLKNITVSAMSNIVRLFVFEKMQTFLVTGGSGFIGSNFILKVRKEQWVNIINLDKLTYASNPQDLAELQNE